MSRRFIPATVAAGATSLQAGDVVTGGYVVRNGAQIAAATVRDVVVQNGLVKLTYENHIPGVTEAGAHTLYRWHNSAWNRCVSTQYGDWSYYAIGVAVTADRCTVMSAGPESVELAFTWDAFDLSSYAGGGVILRDYAGNATYPVSSSTPKRISSTELTKAIKVARGREGYFIGWHSIPMVGPQDPVTHRNSTDYGEQELGTGSGTQVAFSSAGFVSRHPEWGADARWAAAEAAVGAISNRVAWMGIADATYSIWSNATVAATQNAGFPGYQTTGPWWCAEIPHSSVCPTAMCRYFALVAPLELGIWQFGAGQSGDLVSHFTFEHRDASNNTYPYQVFFGAFPYTSPYDMSTEAGRANEPTTALKQRVAARIPLDFEEVGNADDNGVEFMTAASVRDELIAAVEAISA